MSYIPDMPAAARRHLEAAESLPPQRYDVAGYLYGIAAECAIKAMMLEAGMPQPETRNGPFYQHFPELRTSLLDEVRGRNYSVLRRHIENPSFMQEWDITMRYGRHSEGHEVHKRWVEKWRSQAVEAVGCIGT